MTRKVLYVIGMLYMPIFWLMLNITGYRFTFKELYTSFDEHYKSGQEFGPLG